MVWLGAQPSRGRLVATFTHGLSGVNRSGGPRSQAITRTHVASRALARHGHIGVKCTRNPTCVATSVASITVGYDHARQRCVRNMVHGFAVRRRIGTAVAGGALIHDRHLAMVPLGGLPCCRAVAADAIHCSRNVLRRLASRRTAVVTTRTVRG
jgi:hypothetical protein